MTAAICLCTHALRQHHGDGDDHNPSCAVLGCGCRLYVPRVPVGARVPPPDAARRHRRFVVWAAHHAGATYPAIGRALGTTEARARQLAKGYEALITQRHARAATWREPWAKRLRAEGAIP